MKANRAAATRRDAGDAAVSDVIGSILLVAITVLTVGAFALLLFAFDGPRDVPQTNLAVTVQPGNGNWGNGDERIVIHHLGGDALTEGGIRIAYSVNSGAVTSVSGSALGFLQGQFKIGDTWTSPVLTLQSTDVVHVNVVAQAKNSGEALLASLNIIPAQVSAGSTCPFDSTAPSGSWLQSPSDVTILTSSAITVTLTVTDDCAGPDPAAIPHVFWGIS
ncbi:MAG TPA: type IV pilin N-terminal domain-containing protein, partial [Candidatus Thermoplasmatota archaeon]|nr:type IV pilin N-terminal domain-containing protein [Candidatus Thermoplasmatota archaeon]